MPSDLSSNGGLLKGIYSSRSATANSRTRRKFTTKARRLEGFFESLLFVSWCLCVYLNQPEKYPAHPASFETSKSQASHRPEIEVKNGSGHLSQPQRPLICAGQPETAKPFASPTQNSGMCRIHFTQYVKREELTPLTNMKTKQNENMCPATMEDIISYFSSSKLWWFTTEPSSRALRLTLGRSRKSRSKSRVPPHVNQIVVTTPTKMGIIIA